MTRDGPRLSRRDALRTIGAGGALSVVSTTATIPTAAQSAGPAGSEAGRDRGWTSQQSIEDGGGSPCMFNPMFTNHALSYLDVSWEAYGAPGAGGDTQGQGCWRHTFALTGIGASRSERGTYAPGLPYGAFSVNVPTIESDERHPAERASDSPEPTATAVSARRHPATYDFVDRRDLHRFLEDEEVPPRAIADVDLNDEELHQGLYDARSAVADDGETMGSMALTLASTALGAGADFASVADDTARFARFQRSVTLAGIAVGLAGVAAEYLDVLQVETHPRVDRGFAATFPEQIYEQPEYPEQYPGYTASDNYMDGCNDSGVFFETGCHYLLFDVLETPADGRVSAVDVVSGFDRAPSGPVDGPSAGWSIVLDTPAPDGGDPSAVSESERFSATVEQSDRVSRRDPSKEVAN